ncbi:unannotated protein [freshwater metagenome]|uniref:Unannotated protein n=1 Tax=freshwater metagenome TaxID=449393 RepID=A0A6J7N1Y3_9ZZZZ
MGVFEAVRMTKSSQMPMTGATSRITISVAPLLSAARAAVVASSRAVAGIWSGLVCEGEVMEEDLDPS